jgi:hypothetical protein
MSDEGMGLRLPRFLGWSRIKPRRPRRRSRLEGRALIMRRRGRLIGIVP